MNRTAPKTTPFPAELPDARSDIVSLTLKRIADSSPLDRAIAEARDALIRQVSQPVKWLSSVEFLISQGVQSLIETGPGKVLSGLARQIDRSLRCVNVEDKASLCSARETILG